jgi:hypothetical protein
MYFLVRWLIGFFRKPWFSAKKQLIALVAGAIWVSVAALISVDDARLTDRPVSLVFTIFAYSIPAALFSGIAFWWFGKGKPTL